MKILNKISLVLLFSCFCVLTITVAKNEGSPLAEEMSLVISKKVASSVDKTDGEIQITVKGGKAPYKLVVHSSTRSKELVYTGEKFDLKNLPKGFYLLNVTDSENNFTSQSLHL